VFEAGQLKGAILMSFPDRIHALQKSTYGAPTGVERPLDDAAWAQVRRGTVYSYGNPKP
jgi:hypothetical protein